MKERLDHFKNREFLINVLAAIAFLFLSLVVNFYAGLYATERASNAVTDLVLSNTPVFDVDGIFIYGPLLLWTFVFILCLMEPRRIPFTFKSIALFVLIKSAFISLTHIGPFPDQIAIDPASFINKFTPGGDLFFSAHTGLPFLMALIYWENKTLRRLFISASVFFGAVVLLGHMHYSIDVVSAFFITFAIYHIAKNVFSKDAEIFTAGIKS